MISKKIERKNKLQKYMKVLKPRTRKEDLSYTVKQQQSQEQNPQNQEQHQQIKQGADHPIWEDPDDETRINLSEKNVTKKLIKGETIIPQSEYSKRAEEFYISKQQHQFTSWAVEGETGHQLEKANVFEEEFQFIPTKQTTLQYFGKSEYKHKSIVSDICWSKNALYTVGLDKVLTVHKLQRMDKLTPSCHHVKNLPLTKCVYADQKVFIGTLRKNYAVFDANKGMQLHSSTFLSEHKNYSNLRAGGKTLGIFSNKLISIFSLNNQFIGELQTNQPISDLCIQGNDLVATTKNSIYRWDNRTNRIIQVLHTGLNNTSVSIVSSRDSLLVGTFSGMIYSHRLNPSINQVVKEIPNLVTSVSGISSNRAGSLIVAYSKWKKNALRIIDGSTHSVLQSWPSITTKLNFPTAANFSFDGGYLATGSSNGSISLYKVVN